MSEPTVFLASGFCRLRIDLTYDGTNYAGWAPQPDQRTIEGELTSAISKLAGVQVEPVVAGQRIPGLPTPPVKVVEGKVLLNATLKVTPDSVEARNTIPVIREAVQAVELYQLVSQLVLFCGCWCGCMRQVCCLKSTNNWDYNAVV